MKIAWIVLDQIHRATSDYVGYVPEVEIIDGELTSSRASTRLRVLIPMAALKARGHETELVVVGTGDVDAYAARLRGFDAVIFKKSVKGDTSTLELLKKTAEMDVPTLFDICDLPRNERNLEMACNANRVVTCTPHLAALLYAKGVKKVSVITDPYEGPRGEPAWRPDKRLELLWFGQPVNHGSLNPLLAALAKVGRHRPVRLTVLTAQASSLSDFCADVNKRFQPLIEAVFSEWSLEGMWTALAATDMVVVPISPGNPLKAAKSPNRVVEGLWAGRCVVANPLPAYLPFAGWAFIDDDFAHGMLRALCEQERIVARVRSAQSYIAQVHAPRKIAEQWEQAIMEVL